jgi:hypothetical protein
MEGTSDCNKQGISLDGKSILVMKPERQRLTGKTLGLYEE